MVIGVHILVVRAMQSGFRITLAWGVRKALNAILPMFNKRRFDVSFIPTRGILGLRILVR